MEAKFGLVLVTMVLLAASAYAANVIVKDGMVGAGMTPNDGVNVNGSLRVENSSASTILLVNSSSGNVGIGTTDPEQTLHVVSSDYDDQLLIERNSTTPNLTVQINMRNSNGVGRAIGVDGRDNLFLVNPLTGLIVNWEGKVGIGKSDPEAKLTVNGSFLIVNASNETFVSMDEVNRMMKVIGTLEYWDNGSDATAMTPLRLRTYSTHPNAIANLQFHKSNNDMLGANDTTLDNQVIGVIYWYGKNATNDTAPVAQIRVMQDGDAERNAPGEMIFYVGDNETNGLFSDAIRMIIKNTGNVGIGTTDPEQDLHILDDVDATLELESSSADNWDTATIAFKKPNQQWNLVLGRGDTGAGSIGFWDVTGANLAFVIKNGSGNVGIGTTDPAETLHVTGDFLVTNGSNYTSFIVDSSSGRTFVYDTLELRHNSTVEDANFRMRSYSTDLGSFPNFQFHKSHNLNMSAKETTLDNEILGAVIWYGINASNDTLSAGQIRVIQDGDAQYGVPSEMLFYVGDNLTSGLDITSAVRMTIKGETGNVGIGTADPDATLDVDGTTILQDSSIGEYLLCASGNSSYNRVGMGTCNPLLALDVRSEEEGFIMSFRHVGDENNPNFKVYVNETDRLVALVASGTHTSDLALGIGAGGEPRGFKDYLHIQRDTGYVGINTPSPVGSLNINGSNTENVSIIFSNSHGGGPDWWDLGIPDSSNDFRLRDVQNNRDILYVLDGGNLKIMKDGGLVGIGHNSPLAKLHINNTLMLEPTDVPDTVCAVANEGMMYYDASMSEPCFCDGTDWQQFDGGGACT